MLLPATSGHNWLDNERVPSNYASERAVTLLTERTGVRARRGCLLHVALVTAMLISFGAFSQATSAKEPHIPQRFHGKWQGEMRILKLPEVNKDYAWTNPVRFRITITATEPRVQYWLEEKWFDLGRFGITVFDTNAVITSITSGNGGDGTWVETWSLALSVINRKRMHVSAQRQVQNKNLHGDHADSVWGAVAFGKFEPMTDTEN